MSDWKPQKSFAGLVIVAAAKIKEKGLERVKESGISLSYGRIGVLSSLLISEKNQTELCQELKQKAPSMTEMLYRLKTDGMIKQKHHQTDKRIKLWGLSSKGQKEIKLAKQALRGEGKRLDSFFENCKIPKKNIDMVCSVLREFVERYE